MTLEQAKTHVYLTTARTGRWGFLEMEEDGFFFSMLSQLTDFEKTTLSALGVQLEEHHDYDTDRGDLYWYKFKTL